MHDHPLWVLHEAVHSPAAVPHGVRPGICAVTGVACAVDPLTSLPSTFRDINRAPYGHHNAAGVSAAMVTAMRWAGPIRTDASVWRDSALAAIRVHRDGGLTAYSRVVPLAHDRWPWASSTERISHTLRAGRDALIVPTTRKKHSALWARWGYIATEAAAIPDSDGFARCVAAAAAAKEAGVTEGELAASPQPTNRAVGLLGFAAAVAAWEDTGPLRARPDIAPVAFILARQPKEIS